MKKQYDYKNFDKEIVPNIKNNIRNLRDGKFTQEQLAEGLHMSKESRTTITTWENPNKTTIPNIQILLELCNLFDVDINYMLGKTPILSEDNKTIAETLSLSLESVGTLKRNPEYGVFIDNIVNNKNFHDKILQRIDILGRNAILEDVITTSFTPKFLGKLSGIFKKFYNNIFPMDMSKEVFEKCLCNAFPYSESFDSVKFLENNFEEEGRNFVLNNFEGFEKESSDEQYKMIMSSIADISYDYFVSTQVAELSKHRLTNELSKLVEDIIADKANSIREKIKNYANKKNEVV